MARADHARHRALAALVTLLVLGVAACLGYVAWLNRTEAAYLHGADRHDPLWTTVEAAQAYAADTGTLPDTTGELLDWLDGSAARFAAGGEVPLVELRNRVGSSRIGTTPDGAWCAAVQQTRPPALDVLAGLPEQMTSVAVAGTDGAEPTYTHDADPHACTSPDIHQR